MSVRRFRWFVATCASALLAAALTTPAAPAEPQASAAPAHGSTKASKHKHATKPAPHKETTRHEHNKDVAAKPAHEPKPASDKASERRPLFGPLSLGVETDPAVRRRSLTGGEADPDRDPLIGQPKQGLLPSFLGLSVKSEFSW